MQYSKQGLALTERFESSTGPALKAYWDALGKVWTIGWGHTGPEVKEGLVWTYEQCVEALESDVNWANNVINSLVHASLTQSEHDALVDFCFNVGAGNFSKSTMLTYLNQGNMTMAALEFEKWDKAGGQVVAGLLRRRQAEELMFTSGT
jgi:lysozyme